ncbi:MAG: hypothetical protein KF852_07945 [Saprospiraceae bacterium]|nr:hypothetical protein [Saprospiraceae bacterium]
MKPYLFLGLIAMLFAACGPKKTETKAPAAAPPPVGTTMPGLPIEILRTLVAECDYIDVVIYNPPFSMNQQDQANVRGSIQHISETPATHNPANQALGRIFYQIKGETFLEADIFLSTGATYFLFYQDKKPAFANTMTEQGVYFYANILTRVQSGGQQ